MEKIQELSGKTKKLSATFEKDVDVLLKTLSNTNKPSTAFEVKLCAFYENVLQANQFLCEMKCIILQMRHDLHNMRAELKDNAAKGEKEKLVLDLFNAEELFEEVKDRTKKLLDDIVEKRNKMKFTLIELEFWRETQYFMKEISFKIDM